MSRFNSIGGVELPVGVLEVNVGAGQAAFFHLSDLYAEVN